MADVSHAIRPFMIHEVWSERIQEEFFRQGDRETALGLDVSPLCSRTNFGGLEKSQIGFYNFVVTPLVRVFATYYDKYYDALDDDTGGKGGGEPTSADRASSAGAVDGGRNHQRQRSIGRSKRTGSVDCAPIPEAETADTHGVNKGATTNTNDVNEKDAMNARAAGGGGHRRHLRHRLRRS